MMQRCQAGLEVLALLAHGNDGVVQSLTCGGWVWWFLERPRGGYFEKALALQASLGERLRRRDSLSDQSPAVGE